MKGYTWPDQRVIDELGFVRAIRTLLTRHLSILLPSINQTITLEFERQLNKCKGLYGMARSLGPWHWADVSILGIC